MDLFHIDIEKCDRDGICAIECPAHIIRMTDSGPVPAENAEAFCINCGHCVAVCPKGAFILNTLSPDQCLPVEKERAISLEQAEQFLRSRRSIRRYRDKAVERDLLEKALAIACCAPTGSNRQPVQWRVVENRETVRKIAAHTIDWMRYVAQTHPEVAATFTMDALISQWDKGIDRICRDAPHLVFVHASKAFGSGSADCHTAMAYLELILPSFGLGSCWAGYVNYAAAQWPELKKVMGLPEDHVCHGTLMIGYPKFRYARAPKRKAPAVSYMK